MAKELDIPVIALSQLSRQVESRQEKRPILSDLRESGSIEQDADLVVFIYRPEYYKLTHFEDETLTEGKAVILVAKNRHGKTADIRVNFVAEYGRFEDNNIAFNNDFNVPNNIMVKSSRMNEDLDDTDDLEKKADPY
jgi:replicative DNA helicase